MNSHGVDDQIPWTTARCNRLLRPISSRIAALRKGADISKPQKRGKPSAKALQRIDRRDDFLDTPRRSPKKSTDADEWVPEAKPRKIIRKYTANRTTQKRNEPRPAPVPPPSGFAGALLAPTPLINRVIHNVEDTPHAATPLAPFGGGRMKPLLYQQRVILRSVREELEQDRYMHVEGAYAGFQKVLEATARYAPAKEQTGTRSLLSTCLRKVPAYIELEEIWQKEEDEDDEEDICARVYNELEDLATRNEKAQHGLGEVVRAHAIKLVCEAVADRIFPKELMEPLVELCMRTKAWDAGEELFSVSLMTMQSTLEPPSHASDDLFDVAKNPLLAMFRRYVNTSRSWSLMYRQLASLIRSGKIPPEWMATGNMAEVWNRLVRSINQSHALGPAQDLVQGVVLQSLGLENGHSFASEAHYLASARQGKQVMHSVKPPIRRALSNTIDSLLNIYSSAALSNIKAEEDHAKSGSCRFVRMLESLVQSFLVELEYDEDSNYPGDNISLATIRAERACTLLLARMIVEANATNSPGSLEFRPRARTSMMRHLAHHGEVKSTAIMERVSNFFNSLSTSVSHVNHDEQFSVLQRLISSLDMFASSFEHANSQYIRHVAFHTVKRCSETSQDPAHFQYAKTLERSLNLEDTISEETHASETESDRITGMMDGYRWEEGIEEWILCTPALNRKGPKAGPKMSKKAKSKAAQGKDPSVIIRKRSFMDYLASETSNTSNKATAQLTALPTPKHSSPLHTGPVYFADNQSPAVIIRDRHTASSNMLPSTAKNLDDSLTMLSRRSFKGRNGNTSSSSSSLSRDTVDADDSDVHGGSSMSESETSYSESSLEEESMEPGSSFAAIMRQKRSMQRAQRGEEQQPIRISRRGSTDIAEEKQRQLRLMKESELLATKFQESRKKSNDNSYVRDDTPEEEISEYHKCMRETCERLDGRPLTAADHEGILQAIRRDAEKAKASAEKAAAESASSSNNSSFMSTSSSSSRTRRGRQLRSENAASSSRASRPTRSIPEPQSESDDTTEDSDEDESNDTTEESAEDESDDTSDESEDEDDLQQDALVGVAGTSQRSRFQLHSAQPQRKKLRRSAKESDDELGLE